MINYVLRQYQILIKNGFIQAADGSWQMVKAFEEYKISKKEMPDNKEKLTRANMLSKGFLTNDFIDYYFSAESFLKK